MTGGRLHTLWLAEPLLYDGSQLTSRFAYMRFGLLGDSLVAWQGPCDIPFVHMVDGEDVRAQSPIRGSQMLHFIFEKFQTDLPEAVALQRLFAGLSADLLRQLSPRARDLRREGDDLYLDVEGVARKLSISIATVSPVSALFHFAVNISNSGTPVPTLSLQDLGVEPRPFAEELMRRFALETTGIWEACCKVRSVE